MVLVLGNGNLFNLLPNLRQILFHPFRILVFDDFEKVFQLGADIGYLSRSAWVEQNFLKQVIILAQQAFGDSHMFLERSSRSFLMLHYSREYESRDERDRKRVGYCLVMLVECVFENIKT